MTLQHVTCILPAHNEGEAIKATILEIDDQIGKLCKLTIFVSEDGSIDKTRDEVISAKSMVKQSQIILSEKADRLGYSKGVQRGICESETELLLFMDSDGQCNPSDFEKLLSAWSQNALVVGVRSPRADSVKRRIFSLSFKLVYELLGFPRLKDPSSPYILVERALVQEFGTCEWYLNYGFWWEFQARVAKLGLNVIEVPVQHRIRAAGDTQVYKASALPRIVKTHILGLFRLRNDLNRI